MAFDLFEAIEILEQNGFDINAATKSKGADELDQIPYFEKQNGFEIDLW